MVCVGSDTDDTNICIYTGGAASTVKQVDLGVSFPANRPAGSLSTDWFKFTILGHYEVFLTRLLILQQMLLLVGLLLPWLLIYPLQVLSCFPSVLESWGHLKRLVKLDYKFRGLVCIIE